MSIASYSKCRIQFIPKERGRPDVNYSDRSFIELRQNDFADYLLRAIDVDNNRTEIFNIRFQRSNQYKRGATANQPDGIKDDDGLYLLWLNDATRDQFHKALDISIEQLDSIPKEESKPPSPPPAATRRENRRYDDTPPQQPAHHDQNDILVDVYQLGQHIRQGDVNEAVALSKKLATQRIPLQANSWTSSKEEQTIQIRIKIDSNDPSLSLKYDEFTMAVYPSTTIHELRTALEYSNYNLPRNQYFFVNGHLADENFTMKDLNVQSKSLFILFIIQ
ncbi:unnamed protein product [Rotaria sp. Silwood1]|nr:unnamed protein product [Rotaria sp. Silwood1]CAF4607053.1 unnamed protein product [Rotaria sp. Silwood1]